MNVEKIKCKVGIWYEDADGNYIPSPKGVGEIPDNASTSHVCFPLEIREQVTFLRGCDGELLKKPAEITHYVHIGEGNAPVILAMVNSGDYTLSEALSVYAHVCERCANVLAFKYRNGVEGYPEYSEEWKRCGTVCECCKDMEE